MNIRFRAGITRRFFLFALPFALGLLFLLPAVASAHGIYTIHTQVYKAFSATIWLARRMVRLTAQRSLT